MVLLLHRTDMNRTNHIHVTPCHFVRMLCSVTNRPTKINIFQCRTQTTTMPHYVPLLILDTILNTQKCQFKVFPYTHSLIISIICMGS